MAPMAYQDAALTLCSLLYALRFLINRRLDVLEPVTDTQQAFRMPDKQVSAGLQAIVEFVHKRHLSRFIEIYHHIAAENNIEFFIKCERGYQIKPPELDHVPDNRFYPYETIPPSLSFLEELPYDTRRQVFDTRVVVHPRDRSGNNFCGDVGGQNMYFP